MCNYLIYYKNCAPALRLIFSCGHSFLNGEYYTDPTGAPSWLGIIWYHWLGIDYSLKSTNMIIIKKEN